MTRASGARARSAGDAFETWLDRFILLPLVRNGVLGRYDKLSPKMRPVRFGKMLYFVPVADSGGDWILLGQDGLYIAMEAKSTAEDRYYLSSMPKRQVEHLDMAVSMDAGALLALCLAGIPYLIPWKCAPWEVIKSAPSLSAAVCASWRLNNWTDAKRIIET